MRRALRNAFPVSAWLLLSLVVLAAVPILATLIARLFTDAESGLTLIAVGAAVVGLVFVVGGVGSLVVHPLSETAHAARRFANGDLQGPLPHTRVEEIADVLAALDYMRTELQKSEARRDALEQERRMFISGVAHDLRTPLFALIGYLEGLQSGVAKTPERRASYIEAAQGRAKRLNRLVDELFDFARLEYVDFSPDLRPLDFSEFLERWLDDVRQSFEANGQRLVVQAHDGACSISGDTDLLTRAFENLIDNAKRHTPADGSITVAWTVVRNQVQVSVADTGSGIAEEDLPHIFEPAFRGDAARQSGEAGAGLGLSIARRIVELHGGRLTAENGKSGGATFRVSLPALP